MKAMKEISMSYKEVIKASNDRSYALFKGHGGDRGRGKIK